MIHLARLTVPPVAITILVWTLFCFARILKSGDGRTDGQKDGHTDNTCEIVIATGRDCGSASWIKNKKEKKKISFWFLGLALIAFSTLAAATTAKKV